MAFSVQSIKNITGGQILQGPSERVLTAGVCTDSREAVPHCLFFALSGERFDGNSFAAEAAKKGAGAVVVSRPVEIEDKSCAIIFVPDVVVALQQLARWWRARLSGLQVIGVTGSSGKTSTKDLVGSVLKQDFRVTTTVGNFNNHIGLPLCVLKAEPSDQFAVWEMGMNHAGELEPLCQIAQPNIGIISSIGSAHIEYLGSREKIAEEKSTLARSLTAKGVMIFPANCDFSDMIRSGTKGRCITVGFEQGDVRASIIKTTIAGTEFELSIEGFCNVVVKLPLHGRHMVSNSLLAAAAGWVAGMSASDIVAGLECAELTGGRLGCADVDGILVIDDTYNANPESMKAALETAASMECNGKRWVVLGAMGELGSYSAAAHMEVGKTACLAGIDGIISVGEGAELISQSAEKYCNDAERVIRHLKTKQEASAWIKDQVKPGDLILFKGSRSAGIDELISLLFPTYK